MDFIYLCDIELHELFVYFGDRSIVSCFVCKYFFPFCGLSSCFACDFLCCAKAFKFKCLWFYFHYSRRWISPYMLMLCLQQLFLTAIYVRMFCLCFPLSFIVSALHLGLWSILSLFLCIVLASVLISFYLHVASSFPSTTYWSDCLFSIMYSCFFCPRLMDHRCMSLFLGFLSCYIHLYFCFCTRTILFWLL